MMFDTLQVPVNNANCLRALSPPSAGRAAYQVTTRVLPPAARPAHVLDGAGGGEAAAPSRENYTYT